MCLHAQSTEQRKEETMPKEAALLMLVAIGAAVALPMQWLELEHAKTLHKSSRLGEVYKFCSMSFVLCANNLAIPRL